MDNNKELSGKSLFDVKFEKGYEKKLLKNEFDDYTRKSTSFLEEESELDAGNNVLAASVIKRCLDGDCVADIMEDLLFPKK